KRRERNLKFLESPSHAKLLSEYDRIPQTTLLYLVSPGFSHFSYYDLLRPEAEPWGGTPERTATNLTLIRACVRGFLDHQLKGRPMDLAAAVHQLGGEVLLVPPRGVEQ